MSDLRTRIQAYAKELRGTGVFWDNAIPDEYTAEEAAEFQSLAVQCRSHAFALEQILATAEPSIRWGAIPGVCRQCHGPCEEIRGCYAVPTCFKCLPPPPELETIETSAGTSHSPTRK